MNDVDNLALNELESYLWEATHILSDFIEVCDYKSYILPILFLKRLCDVYDEETAALKEHRVVVPKGCHWSDVIATTFDVGSALKEAFSAIESENKALDGIFADTPWTNNEHLQDDLLFELLEHFDQVKLGHEQICHDDMGRVYESLLGRFSAKAKIKACEYYTPRAIIRLMVNVLDPQAGESIYDPACGTGGVFLEAIHHVKSQGGDASLLTLKGQDKNHSVEAIARMSLYLHGVKGFELQRGDSLRDPKFLIQDRLELFDCVIANPPCRSKDWGHEQWATDPFHRHALGLPQKNNGAFAWLMHMYCSMREESGRMAVMLPHSALFRTGVEASIRKKLLKLGALEAVIGLASHLFCGTSMPASILVLKKSTKAKSPVLFINAEEIYTKDNAQNIMTTEQADAIYQLYQLQKQKPFVEESLTRWVEYAEFEAHDFNLNMAKYLQKSPEEEKINLDEAFRDFKAQLHGIKRAKIDLGF